MFTRGSGILLHPTSLPGPLGSGDIGDEATKFLDWLEAAGQRYWQMLPLTPVGYGASPYSSLSAFAANPMLIDLAPLAKRGWISAAELPTASARPGERLDFGASNGLRTSLLQKAARAFYAGAAPQESAAFDAFRHRHAGWLEDYALFMALHDAHDGREWTSWAPELARRDPKALSAASRQLADGVRYHRFTQWVFFEEWANLRAAAKRRGIQLIGDIPIFVAHHSADVWAHPELFFLDDRGHPTVVAGVPPDYFSKTGQRWGNPLYRWDVLARQGYRWWIDRFRAVLELVDVVRIDHFRGFAGYWEIPASEETAINGRWRPGPGAHFFDAVRTTLGALPIIAEDLGVITDEVNQLRDRYAFPGMKVLQFAFGGDATNAFLPHNHVANAVVYTGTHDNDTTRGWFEAAGDAERESVRRYVGDGERDIAWQLIRLASMSVARIALFPLQDVMSLGSDARMNRPGSTAGNWDWRFTWEELPASSAARLAEFARTYGRR
jgi:4-alpha-glucanotransferase